MKRRTQSIRAKALLVLSLFSFGCSRVPKAPRLNPADPLWKNLVANHTGGLIPRKDRIVVEFSTDLFPKEQDGQNADDLLKLSPSVSGSAVIAGSRQVILVPQHDLEAGAYYVGHVRARRLPGISPKTPDFEFLFQVLPRDYSVSLDGLTASETVKGQWKVQGTVATADVEDPAEVSRMLKTELKGQTLTAEWSHEPGGKVHHFTVSGIQRQTENLTLNLYWDGRAMGSDRKITSTVEVPAKSVFKVTEAKSVQGTEQSVVVYFSDLLNTHQNIKGLARLDGVRATVRVEGSALKLFPQERIAGKATVIIDEGLQNAEALPLGKTFSQSVTFTSQKPQVRFVGSGVILPENPVLSIPFETMNVKSVQVAAFQIYSTNMGHFLQANKLGGDQELERVGRFLWRKTIAVPASSADQWQRYSLDATELLHRDPGGLYRLTLSINRSNSSYACSEEENRVLPKPEEPLKNNDDLNVSQASGWDGIETYYEGGNQPANWQDRDDPCKDSYYQFTAEAKDTRNFLASDIGLLAKADQRGALHIVATHLRTAEAYSGVSFTIFNFQNQPIGSGVTDGDGTALVQPTGKPFYLQADKDGQRGYLKLSEGTALPISHFDTGGERTQEGLKGTIYGERGVWRPGDEIHLVFVLEDKAKVIPEGHPATLRLFNPKGQLVDTRVNSQPVDGFYRFSLRTAEDAPTGSWTAKVQLGGSEFTKSVRIEAIMPNRLKVDMDLGKEEIHAQDLPLKARLSSVWLHGATAAGLKADVSVQFSPAPVSFTRFSDHVYSDPARTFDSQPVTLFTGNLDENGKASFGLSLETPQAAPSMLNAEFYMRVFEEGGAFSGVHKSYPFYSYKRYIGIKLPKGDESRNMLMTDKVHTVSVTSLDSRGNPVSVKKIQMTLYKIEWKWWWDKSGETLAQYSSGSQTTPIKQEVVSTRDGRGEWNFEVKYPEWGRFLIRACDLDGGHCTGQVFYIDWPGWAGRAKEQGGPGASVLMFYADKPEYRVGDTATLRLPEATEGRALLSIENGSRVLQQKWLTVTKKETHVEVPITKDMSPNVYASITLLQPHQDKKNDLPIRLYGVIPLIVKDPATEFTPMVEAADEWKPESSVSVKVSEAKGREMTYTLAVVDEGLLGLTVFKTPDLHAIFYKKEALGVVTWDLFDEVVGAYGGELERLLALGGGEDRAAAKEKDEKRRFPPVVKFLGPFHLDGGSKTHTIELPSYVGAVRVMVVAGHRGAYGHADKSIFVRQPLMLLSTLPRLVSPDEEISVPVSVFAMHPNVKDVDVHVAVEGPFDIVGPSNQMTHFEKPGEKLVSFQIKSRGRMGEGVVRITAGSGTNEAHTETHLTVRRPNPPVTKGVIQAIDGKGSWTTAITPHGIPGTQEATLEISGVPPLSLERRLAYLIEYPYGCVEQTTSAVFPQLYLPPLVTLTETQKKGIETNVKSGIQRLRTFQSPSGGFVYWPGQNAEPQTWATNYAGHFLIEAEHHGYAVPADMRSQWVAYQRSHAQSWEQGGTESPLEQAYRLYTLALAGEPELGAMNRLREWPKLPNVARWQLAAAYQLAGVHDASDALATPATLDVSESPDWMQTYGSALRDKAILVQAMVARKDFSRAKPLADELSKSLSSMEWHSTQETAYALMAMASFYGTDVQGQSFSYRYQLGDQAPVTVQSPKPIHSVKIDALPEAGEALKIENLGDRKLFAALSVRGVPAAGHEESRSEGLQSQVFYEDAKGESVNPENLKQGTELAVRVVVKNLTSEKIDNISLTQMAPAGWEIHTTRWQERSASEPGLDYQDVRDDRIYSYFKLEPEQEKTFTTRFTAAYLGKFYLPGVSVEPMYDATKGARTTGQWITVKKEL